jgi:hypothetical protein
MEMPDRKQLAQVIKEAIEKHYGGARVAVDSEEGIMGDVHHVDAFFPPSYEELEEGGWLEDQDGEVTREEALRRLQTSGDFYTINIVIQN